jgi:hypothetical protein
LTLQGEVYVGLEGLLALATEWSRLERLGGGQGYATAFSAYEALLRYRHPEPSRARFFCLRLPGRGLAAIVPLEVGRVRIRRCPFAAWRFPADPDRPSSGFLLHPSLQPESIWSALLPLMSSEAPGVGLLALERTERGSPTWRALQASPFHRRAVPQGELARLAVDRSITEVFAGTTRKFQRNLAWGQRRLQRLLELDYRVARDPAALAPALEAFLALEAAGWKGSEAEGKAILRRPEVARHARGAVDLMGAQSECEIHGLWHGHDCMAALVVFRSGDELYAFKVARSEEVIPSVSLGQQMMYRFIENATGQPGIRTINFGWEGAWLRPWGTRSIPLEQAYLALRGWRSRAALQLLG